MLGYGSPAIVPGSAVVVSRDLRPLFILSLPRTGSTLVQRVLAAHEGVATTSEPWLALPQFYALRPLGADGEYDHRMMAGAVTQFAGGLPDGMDGYLRHVHDFLLGLYAEVSPPGTRWFVDKTPRYHLVVEELVRTFPEAGFVVLWRNPLAVLGSMSRTWDRGLWVPWRHGIDLFTGMDALVHAADWLGDRAVAVRYEDLVTDRAAWQPVFDLIEVEPHESVFEAIGDVRLAGRFGDPHQGHYGQISVDSVDRWMDALASPVRTAWCRRYLEWIGQDRLAAMGYDLDEMQRQLVSVDTSVRLAVRDVATAGRERLRVLGRRWRGEGPVHREWPRGSWPWTSRPPSYRQGPGVDTAPRPAAEP